MKTRTLIVCLLMAAVSAAFVQAEDTNPEFKHPAAKRAKILHEKAVERAEKAYQAALKNALREYHRNLDGAMEAATKAGDLDEALKIRKAKGQAFDQLKALARGDVPGNAADKPEPEEKQDPIVGVWKWFNNKTIPFYPDGTMRKDRRGKWRRTDGGKYVLEWPNGFRDNTQLIDDGKRLTGVNQKGHKVWGRRISPLQGGAKSEKANDQAASPKGPKDPIVGVWKWFNGGVIPFHADGTMGNGRRGKWRRTGSDKYILEWPNGFRDNMKLIDDGKRLTGFNQRNRQRVGGRKIAPPQGNANQFRRRR